MFMVVVDLTIFSTNFKESLAPQVKESVAVTRVLEKAIPSSFSQAVQLPGTVKVWLQRQFSAKDEEQVEVTVWPTLKVCFWGFLYVLKTKG